MEGSANWAGLHADILESISWRLAEPKDFISFRAVCPQWREAIPRTAHARFLPWILKSDEVRVSGNVLFYSLGSERYHKIHVPALKGRRTRLAGFGAGHLVGIDEDDELAAVLVNPLTGESTALPRLPERFRGTVTHGFATDPEMVGEDRVSVAIYNWWPTGHRRIHVALWRRGGHGWAVLPSERFWTRMPEQRSRLAAHEPEVLELEGVQAAIAAGGDAGEEEEGEMEMQWVPCMKGGHLMEHGGQVRFLFRMEDKNGLCTPPRVAFELRDMLGGNNWADAPELRDKVIFQSADTCCHVLPVPSGDDNFAGLMSKNSIYFLYRHRRQEGDASEAYSYCLCKWDLMQRTAIIVKEIPGYWDWSLGRWFLPTLKY